MQLELDGERPAASGPWVDPVLGSDASSGTKTFPLKTIKKAFALAKSGDTVNLFPGTFGSSNGDDFSTPVPNGVALPDSTAVRVALWRALHVEADASPHVFEDEVGLRIANPAEGCAFVQTWWRSTRVPFERPLSRSRSKRAFERRGMSRARCSPSVTF